MVGVMCNVGGGLGWAVSPESDRWGLSPSLRPPERGLLDRVWRFRPGLDEPAATGFALHSFSRLWVKDTRVNSPATLWMPRSRNCLKPRTCLVSPWTGSVMTLRRAYTSRPSGVCSLDRMAERSGVLTFTC